MGVSASVDLTSNFAAITGEVLAGVARGETLAAERLLAYSSEQVPFEIGTLSSTGAVVPATDPEEGAAVTYDTPYAARLHEHPEFNFQNGRKGKYVEDPALEHRDELGAIVVKEAAGG